MYLDMWHVASSTIIHRARVPGISRATPTGSLTSHGKDIGGFRGMQYGHVFNCPETGVAELGIACPTVS
jgi:hypothetical protein